jgi:hypothetical protein
MKKIGESCAAQNGAISANTQPRTMTVRLTMDALLAAGRSVEEHRTAVKRSEAAIGSLLTRGQALRYGASKLPVEGTR